MLAEYRYYRSVAMHLNSRIVKIIKRHELDAAARSLGIVVRGIMVFDSEDETSVLMDRAIYDLRRGNKNILACFIDEHVREDFSETEWQLLQGKSKAWFSLFEILAAHPAEAWVQLRDLINSTGPFRMFDVGLSQTAPPGQLIATRLVPINDWHMTTGVSHPFRSHHAMALMAGLKRAIPHAGKRKYKIVRPEDFSSYFFREYKLLDEIKIGYHSVYDESISNDRRLPRPRQ